MAEDGARCGVCGAEMDWEECWDCHGHGGWWPARENDSRKYAPDDWERCQTCQGDGGYWACPAAAWHEPGRDE